MTEGREIELTPANQEQHKVVYMRANPERNTVTFLDTAGKPLYHDQFRTEEARQRIQQEKNTRESSASFVKGSRQEQSSNVNTTMQENGDAVKKKNDAQAVDSLKPNKRPRVVQTGENKKGKAI